MTAKFRVFATCDIGESIDLLRKRGYDVEVYPKPEAPPKSSDSRESEIGHRWPDHHFARSRSTLRFSRRAKDI